MHAATEPSATWRYRLQRALHEAGFILIFACLLGLAYNAVTRKGIFAPEGSQTRAGQGQPVVSPRFITFEEAVELHRSGNAVFVDSRSDYDYRMGHIEGAVNIPLKEFGSHQETLERIPKSSVVVIYCDGQECNSSIELAKSFIATGYLAVNVFFGGWTEWQTRLQPAE